ncbi:MAG: LysR family transcriptional regulator [Pseudomonadota bacterium]
MDRLTSLEVFNKVVETESFSQAARQLGLSRAMASKHVQALENRLGVRLLNRTTRRLSLTEAGSDFYTRTAQIVADLEDAEAKAADLNLTPRGVLKVNAPLSFALSQLSPILPAFLADHREVRIDLTLNDRIVDLVDEGYDLAIRVGLLADSSLIARKLATCRMVLCASPGYLKKHGALKSPDDLTDHNCLGYSYSARPSQWEFHGLKSNVTVSIKGNLVANNGDILRDAAIADEGIVIQPSFIVGNDLCAGRLVPLLTEWKVPDIAVYALYPENRHVAAKVRSFVDFLVKRFGPEPPWDDWRHQDCQSGAER